jgi:hypothetical protein
MYYVYELVDPRTNIAGYIGITKSPEKRLISHLARFDRNDRKNEWIGEILLAELKIQMNVIETVDTLEIARERERYWIKNYIDRKIALYNVQGMPTIAADRLVKSQKRTEQPKPLSPVRGRRIDDEYYRSFEFPIEYLSADGYLDDLFADWIEDMEETDHKKYTEQDVRIELDLHTLCMLFTYHGDDESELIEAWYKNQFEKGGRFEGDKITLNLK